MFGETGVPDPATFLALAVAAVVQMVLVVGTTGHVLGNRDTRA